jgi:hypothetical protein
LVATRRGPDNSVRASFVGIRDAVNIASVFHMQLTVTSTPSQADLDAWLTSAQGAYKTLAAPYACNDFAWSQAQAIFYAPGGGEVSSQVAMTGTGSGGVSTIAPNDVCAVISWLAGVYWRGGKPRTYLPPLPPSLLVDGKTLTAATQTGVVSAANTFRTAINALSSGAITGTSLGFVSFQTGGVDRPTPLFYAYIGAKCHPRPGTQRRRLGKWRP